MKFTPHNFSLGQLRPNTILLIIAGIFVLILIATSVFIVDQTEQAVITRFGKFIGIREPGLHFKLPFGIDRNYTVKVTTVFTEEFGFRTTRSGNTPSYSAQGGESIMLTGDLNIVDIEWIIQYRVVDPIAWTFNVNERPETIRDVSRSAINMLVGDRAIMAIMGVERSAIEMEALEIMNDTFAKFNLGINVIAVKLQNVTPPAGVREAFEDVNKAMQDRERLINEGQQAYNEEIPKARGQAQRIIQVAEGYAVERVNRARGDVSRFNEVYNEYRNARDVTRQRLYYEMVEEVFKTPGTTIIDRNLDNFLPLMSIGGGR